MRKLKRALRVIAKYINSHNTTGKYKVRVVVFWEHRERVFKVLLGGVRGLTKKGGFTRVLGTELLSS